MPELESAIRAVEKPAGRGAVLTRHEARPVLLCVGLLLQTGRSEELGDAGDRLRRLPERPRESCVAAVQDELSMAATEYVRSVDPRFLNHPQYDLDYTLEARRQLDARWRACLYFGLAVDPAAQASVERADRLLEARMKTRIAEWLAKRASDAAN
ncbi:MAG: hypothetical protein ACKVXR_03160 [Planctomycetota bacterium]